MTSPSAFSLEPSAWLAAIVEGSEDAIVSKTLDGTILSWNGGAQKLFGYSAEEAIGHPITLIIPEERLHEEEMIIATLKAGQRTEHFETMRRRKDGSLIDVSLTVSPVRDKQGRLLGASKVARDITGSRQMAEQQALLLQEMNHRIKNLFALATGLVALCRRGAETVDTLARDLQSRLMALAKAHDATLRPVQDGEQGAGLSLRGLLGTLLEPYEGRSGPRIVIGEGDVLIGPRSLSSIALLLHELATNSAKYGALGSEAGVLSIALDFSEPEIILIWNETGQEKLPARPAAKGFGSRLEEMAVRALNARLHRDWWVDRLQITMRFDRDKLAS